jgi:hypothetical protein
MDQSERLVLLADLAESHCELNHGPGTDKNDYRAVNYIVIPMGYKENEIQEITKRELVVPVCQECINALLDNEWTLLYCFDCCQSQWVNRKWARNRYRHNILWLRGCPKCSNEFGGLYFNDMSGVIAQPELKFAVEV